MTRHLCSSCGATNEFVGAVYCARCGELLPAAEATPPKPGSTQAERPDSAARKERRQGPDGRRTLVIVAALAVAAITIGAVVVATSGNDSSQDASGSSPTVAMPTTSAAPPSSSISSATAAESSSTGAPGNSTAAGLQVAFRAARPADPGPYSGARANLLFVSPSINVSCLMVDQDGSNRVTCTIGSYDFTQPGPDCGQGAQVGIDDEGVPAYEGCATQPFSPDSSRVLSYGRSLKVGRIGCFVTMSGVSCLSLPSGQGFTLSRESMRIYPASTGRSLTQCPGSATLLTAWNVSHPTSATSVSQIACSGSWATAAVTVEGNAVAGLFKFRANRWTWLDRSAPCAAGQVPSAIFSQACESS